MVLKFETIPYADISTFYLERSDLDLIGEPECPGHMAEHDDGRASFFNVFTDDRKRFNEEAKAFGLSDRFRAIMQELARLEIQYVRFDADGCEVEGLEYCNH